MTIPPRYLYLLFVDGKIGSAYEYEQHEVGSVASMFEALTYLIPTDIPVNFNVDELKLIHQQVMSFAVVEKQKAGIFRDHSVYLHFRDHNVTQEGITEFLDFLSSTENFYTDGSGPNISYSKSADFYDNNGRIDPENDEKSFTISKETLASVKKQLGFNNNTELALHIIKLHRKSLRVNSKGTHSGSCREFIYQAPGDKNIGNYICNIFNLFHSELKLINKEKIKNVKFITDVIRSKINLSCNLVKLHPFYDGNNRVFINVLLNISLFRSLGKLASFEDPNIDFISTQERMDCVNTGMQNIEKLRLGEKNIFNEESKIKNLAAELNVLKHTWIFLRSLNKAFMKFLKESFSNIEDSLQLFYDKFCQNKIHENIFCQLEIGKIELLLLLFNEQGNNLLMLIIENNNCVLMGRIVDLYRNDNSSERINALKSTVARLSFTGKNALQLAKEYKNDSANLLLSLFTQKNTRKRKISVVLNP